MQGGRYNIHMISKYTYKGLTWIDLVNPTNGEVDHINEDYNIPSVFAKELLNNDPEIGITGQEDIVEVVLNFPKIKNHKNNTIDQKIVFLVGHNFIITSHEHQIDTLTQFSKKLEVKLSLEQPLPVSNASLVYFSIVKTLISSNTDDQKEIEIQIENIQKKHQKHSKKLISQIMNLKKVLIDFKYNTEIQKNMLSYFDYYAESFFKIDTRRYTNEMAVEYSKLESIINMQSCTIDNISNMINIAMDKRIYRLIFVFSFFAILALSAILILRITAINF